MLQRRTQVMVKLIPLRTKFIRRLYNIDLFFLYTVCLILFQEDLLIHGDSVYDIIDKQDHGSIQAELGRSVPPQPGSVSSHHSSSPVSNMEGEHRMFLCRMNVSRNARRQMRFGDQKVRISMVISNNLNNKNKKNYSKQVKFY